MSRQLPDLIDPVQIAEKGQEITGQVAISRMHRLQDSLISSEGCLEAVLRFGKDETGQRYIKGRIQGSLQLCCQRCMKPMAWPLDTVLSLALLHSEAQIESLAEQYEPFLVPEDKVKLVELLEDEVILQLPLVPRHELEQCPAGQTNFEFGDKDTVTKVSKPRSKSLEQSESKTKPENPFSVLAGLKQKDKDKDKDKSSE